MFLRILKLALVLARRILELAEAPKLALLEVSNVLKSFPFELTKSIGFTVPNLALVIAAIDKLVAALSGALAVLPLSRVHVAIPKHFLALAMLLALHEMAGVDISSAELQLAKAVLLVLYPVAFKVVSVLEQLNAVPFLQALAQLPLVVPAGVFFKHFNEVRRCFRLAPHRLHRSNVFVGVDA